MRRLGAARARVAPIRLAGEVNSLCRGAVVLLCARLEAFIEELGEILLEALVRKAVDRSRMPPQLFFYIFRNAIEELQETRDPSGVATKLLDFIAREGPMWARSGPFPAVIDAARFNSNFATPNMDKIRSYFGRFGFVDYRRDLSRILGADITTTLNMVDHLVATRNQIAHGDISVQKTPSDIQSMVEIIRKFARATDKVFADWCATQFCSVR